MDWLRPVEFIGERAAAWSRVDPWTNVYGLARTLLALGTAGTLAFSHSTTLFRPAVGVATVPICQGIARYGWFCVFPKDQLEAARWLAVAILLVVASGWRPRVTAALQWWIATSYFRSAVIQDGGDQITSILTLLLLPAALLDRRRWHWYTANMAAKCNGVVASLVALVMFAMIRLQIAGLYLHTSVSKFSVPEWANGTVLYYWLTDPSFGVASWLRPAISPLVTNGFSLTLMTYGTLILELFLFTALVMPKTWWRYMLAFGIALHATIAIMMGLVSFSIAMFAALILYLRPVTEPFQIPAARLPRWENVHPRAWTALSARLQRVTR